MCGLELDPRIVELRSRAVLLAPGRIQLAPGRIQLAPRRIQLAPRHVAFVARHIELRIGGLELRPQAIELGRVEGGGGGLRRRRLLDRDLSRRLRIGGRRRVRLGHGETGSARLLRGQRQTRRQLFNQVRGRDRRPHVQVRHERDVAERQRVRRVGHRHEQAPVGLKRQRHGPVALSRGGREQVGGLGIHIELGQVDVAEPVAGCERAGEVVLGEPSLLNQDLAHVGAREPRVLDRAVHVLFVHQPELDDHVAEEPRPAVRRAV